MPRIQKLAVGVVCSLVLLSVAAPVAGVASPPKQVDDGPSVGTVSVTDNVSVWERAPLPLRTDPGGPTQVEGMSLFFNVPSQNTGDVPLNKPVMSVYNKNEPITMQFQSSLGAGTESLAGEDAQLVAVQLENESSMQRFTDGITAAEVRDLVAGDSDAVSAEVLDDEAGVGTIDDAGELNASYTPSESGGYIFLLATVDSGNGMVTEDGDLRADGDATVVGMDAALVQDEPSDVTPNSDRVAPGDDVEFDVETNVEGENVTHGVVVYRKAELVSERATARLEGDLDRNVSTDQLTVRTTLDRIEGTSDVQEGTTLLGVNLSDERFSFPTSVEGLFDIVAIESTGGQGQGQEDVLHASMTVVEAGPDGTVTVQTGEDWPNGNYRFVHVATSENASQISVDDGRITMNPGGGGGPPDDGDDGQGGGPGDGGDGDDEDEDDDHWGEGQPN